MTIQPLPRLPPEKHTSAIDMNSARRRLGVLSDKSARPIGSMAEKKIPEIPRSQASMAKLAEKAAQKVSKPTMVRHIARTGLRPMRSASGGSRKAPTAIPICWADPLEGDHRRHVDRRAAQSLGDGGEDLAQEIHVEAVEEQHRRDDHQDEDLARAHRPLVDQPGDIEAARPPLLVERCGSAN